MAPNSYRSIPKTLVAFRMIAPAIAAFVVGYVGMGITASLAPLAPLRDSSAYIPSLGDAPRGGPIRMARFQLSQTAYRWTHVPAACVPDQAVNDFQRGECAKFWSFVMVDTAIAGIPLLVVLVFLLVASDRVRQVYRRGRRAIEAGHSDSQGMVTRPAEAPQDSFSWFFGLRPIAVQLRTKEQVKVYIPLDYPIPMPGQTLAMFSVGRVLGRARYLGVLYAPNLAVIGVQG